jgi:hypothetical protein
MVSSRRTLVLSLGAALVACGAERTTAEAVPSVPTQAASVVLAPEPAATPSSTPPAPASASSAIPTELLRNATAEDRAKLDLASQICPAAIRKNHEPGVPGQALRVGCRACPPFDKAPPDGKLPFVEADDRTVFELLQIFPGSFSKAGKQQAAVVIQGCEPSADPSKQPGVPTFDPGGTLLVEKEGPTWRALEYRSGFRPSHCMAFPRNGERSLLVCRLQGRRDNGAYAAIVSYDFAEPSGAMKTLVAMDSNEFSTCVGRGNKGNVVVGKIQQFSAEDIDKDGAVDLSVTVMFARTPAKPALCERLVANMAHLFLSADSPDTIEKLFGMKEHRLVFRFDGEKLTTDAATRKLIARFPATKADAAR